MTVLVTGAAGGIGSAVVDVLRAAGTPVLAHDLRMPPDARSDVGVDWVAGDLLDLRHRDDLARRLRGVGLSALIVAHGTPGNAPLARLERRYVQHVLSVNFLSVPQLVDLALPALARGRGVAVVIASEAGVQGEPNSVAYCAGKFALVGWCRAAAGRLERQGVRIRAFCPGPTDTALFRAAAADLARIEGIDAEAYTRRRASRIPVGRIADPGDMAQTAVWLAMLRTRAPLVATVTGGEVMR